MAQRVSLFILVGAALIVAWLATFHVVSGGPDLTTRDLIVLVVAGLSVVALLGALRLQPTARMKAALLVASVGFAALAAETSLAVGERVETARRERDPCRKAVGEKDKCRAALAAGLPFDTRGRTEILLEGRASGAELWPALSSWGLRLMDQVVVADGNLIVPLGGISSVPTLYCNEHGAYVRFDSDEAGFRNPPGLHSSTVEALLLGDSFAQGYCVPDGSTIADFIRRQLPRTLNLGWGGQGPFSELATFREYGMARRPARVIWLFYEGNDFLDLEDEKARPGLRRYLDPEFRANLFEHQAEVDRQLKAIVETQLERQRTGMAADAQGQRTRPVSFTWELTRWATLYRIRRLIARAVTPEPGVKYDLEALGHTLVMVRDEASRWGGRLSFVYLPAWERYARGETTNADRDGVLRLLDQLNIPVIDIHEVFVRHPDPITLFPFELHGHYTVEGYRLVADAILDALAEPQSIPITTP